MDKEQLVKLTEELYHLTLLFPKKEPLRYKMREVADDVLAGALRAMNNTNGGNYSRKENHNSNVLKDLDILDAFFEVAKNQNWTSRDYVLKTQQDYSKLKEDLSVIFSSFKIQIQPKENQLAKPIELPAQMPTVPPENVTDRQKNILEFIKEKGKAQVWEVKKVFPELSKRTLRRDFESLLKMGLVLRVGSRNNTFYELPR